ncbi:MAG: hypothetical protein NTZ10_05835 [Candidatus Saganbacteria bacterium]|nr:hypothetical protein [Candidatus Saganbacteria bacterium]
MKTTFSATITRDTVFNGRKAVQAALSTDRKGTNIDRITIHKVGGSIPEILIQSAGKTINPLWIPPWQSQEPDKFDLRRPEYQIFGAGCDGPLLAGITGLNMCFPIFGGGELKVFGGAHGEVNKVPWTAALSKINRNGLTMNAKLPITNTAVNREIGFSRGAQAIGFDDTFSNRLASTTRIATIAQHMTFSWEFMADSVTYLPKGTRGVTFPYEFFTPRAGEPTKQLLTRGEEFEYPLAPAEDGSLIDLSVFPKVPESDCATMHMPKTSPFGWFVVRNLKLGISLGCIWSREQYPFLVRWAENLARWNTPWAETVGHPRTRAIGWEFANTAFPVSLEEAIKRETMFGDRTVDVISCKSSITKSFVIFALGPDVQTVHDVRLTKISIQILHAKDKPGQYRDEAEEDIERTSIPLE